MEVLRSCRCAVTQHLCSAALLWAKCISNCSVWLCNTGSQHACFTAFYTYGGLVLIRVCSQPAPMFCSIALRKTQFTLFSAVLHNRLTACWCRPAIAPMRSWFSSRCAVTQHLCSAALLWAKCISYCSMLCCKHAHSMLASLQLHLWRFSVHADVQ